MISEKLYKELALERRIALELIRRKTRTYKFTENMDRADTHGKYFGYQVLLLNALYKLLDPREIEEWSKEMDIINKEMSEKARERVREQTY